MMIEAILEIWADVGRKESVLKMQLEYLNIETDSEMISI